jgi:hypothetical protein
MKTAKKPGKTSVPSGFRAFEIFPRSVVFRRIYSSVTLRRFPPRLDLSVSRKQMRPPEGFIAVQHTLNFSCNATNRATKVEMNASKGKASA